MPHLHTCVLSVQRQVIPGYKQWQRLNWGQDLVCCIYREIYRVGRYPRKISFCGQGYKEEVCGLGGGATKLKLPWGCQQEQSWHRAASITWKREALYQLMGSVFHIGAVYPVGNRGLLMNTQGLILYCVGILCTFSSCLQYQSAW